MIYFDNAATGGRKPSSVVNAVAAALRVSANPSRSGHFLSVACAKNVFKTRKLLAEVFDADDEEKVVFTKNCTEAINAFLFGVLKKGDHVVATALEHNSVLRPLEKLKNDGVITYDVCPIEKDGNVSPKKIASLINEKTALVAVTAASNVTGVTPPLAEIKKALPKDVLFFCDGAQGGGHIPLKMRETGIDGLSLAGHKGLFAMQGSGALLLSKRACVRPLLYGGTGSESLSLNMPDFLPDALEAGTLSYPSIVSLLEGTRYYVMHGEQTAQKLRDLTARLLNGLNAISSKEGDIQLYSSANECGIVAFSVENLPSETLATLLSEKYAIAVRGGLHCAPLAHESLGTQKDGLLRVSFSAFNAPWEIDVFLTALTEIKNAAARSYPL